VATQKESSQQSTLKNEAAGSGTGQKIMPKPEKDLFYWKAPARPFKRRDRQFWVRLLAIAGVFGFILFLIEGVMPVILIISLMFLFYILSTVEPEQIEYTITNKGVKIADKTTEYGLFNRFWFSKRFDDEILVLETANISGRLELVIKSKDKDKIRKVLSEYIAEEKASPTRLDQVAGWVSKKFPQ
jgi:hypothetical protein